MDISYRGWADIDHQYEQEQEEEEEEERERYVKALAESVLREDAEESLERHSVGPKARSPSAPPSAPGTGMRLSYSASLLKSMTRECNTSPIRRTLGVGENLRRTVPVTDLFSGLGVEAKGRPKTMKTLLEEKKRVADSVRFATAANAKAQSGLFSQAFTLYNLAIELHDKDSRYFCNRSYCNEKLGRYKAALTDATRAIALDARRPKAHYMQGMAFFGLQKYEEAEKAFKQALLLDPKEEDYEKELVKIKKQVLLDLGCNDFTSSLFAQKFSSIREAVDNVLVTIPDYTPRVTPERQASGLASFEPHTVEDKQGERNNERVAAGSASGWQEKRSRRRQKSCLPSFLRSVSAHSQYQSDNESASSATSGRTLEERHSAMKVTTSQLVTRAEGYPYPQNIFGFLGIWMSNIFTKITENKIRQTFSRFGQIIRISIFPNDDHAYAFVTFDNPKSPSDAIYALFQKNVWGLSKGTSKLKFRFAGGPGQDTHWMKTTKRKETDECYFWRTTGCNVESNRKCSQGFHHEITKGIDCQLWMTRNQMKHSSHEKH